MKANLELGKFRQRCGRNRLLAGDSDDESCVPLRGATVLGPLFRALEVGDILPIAHNVGRFTGFGVEQIAVQQHARTAIFGANMQLAVGHRRELCLVELANGMGNTVFRPEVGVRMSLSRTWTTLAMRSWRQRAVSST